MMKHLFKLLLTLFSLHTCQSQFSIRDTAVVAPDGAKLDASFIYPPAPAPPGGYPAIVFVHGFGGSKQAYAPLLPLYALNGYVAVSYSVRGQGASEGLFDFFTSSLLQDDLRSVIHFVRNLPNINSERVGVLGDSQGGIHAWMASMYGMGARAVVARIASPFFDETWLENNSLDLAMVLLITFNTTTRMDGVFKNLVTQASQGGDRTALQQYLKSYSLDNRIDSMTAPLMLCIGYFDQLFNPRYAFKRFTHIPGTSKLIAYPDAHELPKDSTHRAFLERSILRWFEYWLKDKEQERSITSADSAVMIFDGGNKVLRVFTRNDSLLWNAHTGGSHAKVSSDTMYFRQGQLSDSRNIPTGQELVTYLNALGSNILHYRSPALPKERTFLGGKATLRFLAGGPVIQANLLLFDRDTATGIAKPITRGQLTRSGFTGGSQQVIEFELNPSMHTLAAGHILEAQIHCGAPLVPDLNVHFGNVMQGPNANSINAIQYGGENATRVELLFLEASPVSSSAGLSNPETLALHCYPQPLARGQELLVEVGQHPEKAELRVFDNLGRCRMMRLLDSNEKMVRIQTAEFVPGIYHLQFKASSGFVLRSFVVFR